MTFFSSPVIGLAAVLAGLPAAVLIAMGLSPVVDGGHRPRQEVPAAHRGTAL